MTDSPGPTASPDRFFEVFDLVGPLYRRIYRKVEQDTAAEGISAGVRAVLVMLHADGPATVPDMGRSQALSRQFTQRMVNEAAARGLVEAVPNPAHKRSSLIRLTPDGTDLIAAVLERERAALSAAAAGLTDSDFDACSRVLSRLLLFLDDVDVD